MSEAARRQLREWGAETAIILGSGLGTLVDLIPPEARISYGGFDHLPAPKVNGHRGEFALGECHGCRLIYAQGRVHLYEGYSAQEVTAGVRLLASCGIKRLILTNAAGALNADFTPGSWMMLSDQLNLTGTTPLLGRPKFVDMSDTYSRKWRDDFRNAASAIDIKLHEGVYAGVLGPQYETPAEVRMLRTLGADAVGMSTVLEAIQAHALGLQVAGFACLTNWAAGINSDPLSHEEVLAIGAAAADSMRQLLEVALA